MEGKRERRWTPTRAKAPDTRASPIAWKLTYWTPASAEPIEQWIDGLIKVIQYIETD